MKLFRNISYGSHAPVLVRVLDATFGATLGSHPGPVVELGTGIFSTPLLHWFCLMQQRFLVSMENRQEALDMFNLRKYETEEHEIYLVRSWAEAPLEQPWDVALVDHEPAERRAQDALRLLPWAKFVVVHDTGWWDDKHYNFKRDLFPKVKYVRHYRPGQFKTQTSVLSQTLDVRFL